MNDTTITIKLTDYDVLQYNDTVFHFLADAVFNAARLNYSGDGLYFSDSSLDAVLKLLLPDTYHKTLKMLQEQKAADDLFEKGE